MIQVKELSKTIGNKQVLKGINLTIPKGAIYGIVGINGAGKTTLIRHMVGAYQGDQGYVEIDNNRIYDNAKIKERLVYIPDEFPDVFGSNIRDIKNLYRNIYPTFNETRYKELLQLFKRDELENILNFSKGMKKQILFILALSIMPDYLIMDEPFDGLDPQIRKTVWDILIQDVAQREMTIFISSHHLKELDIMCDYIAFINNGEVVFEKNIEELKDNYYKVQLVTDKIEDIDRIKDQLNIVECSNLGKIYTLIARGNSDEITKIINQYNPIVHETIRLNLEEIFLFSLGGTNNEFKDILD